MNQNNFYNRNSLSIKFLVKTAPVSIILYVSLCNLKQDKITFTPHNPSTPPPYTPLFTQHPNPIRLLIFLLLSFSACYLIENQAFSPWHAHRFLFTVLLYSLKDFSQPEEIIERNNIYRYLYMYFIDITFHWSNHILSWIEINKLL